VSQVFSIQDAVSIVGHLELFEAREALFVGEVADFLVVEQLGGLAEDSKCYGVGNVFVVVVGIVVDGAEDSSGVNEDFDTFFDFAGVVGQALFGQLGHELDDE